MIHIIEVINTDQKPMRPTDAEFGVTIDFTRGESDPVQVFSAMTDLLSAFVAMDRVLIGAVSPGTEPFSVIEDVEAASLTTWLRNKLTKVDDQALKEFDWRQQIGAYAVKAKYRIIKFLDDREAIETSARRSQLKSDLEALGADLAPGLLPASIDLRALAAPMNRVQDAKAKLTRGERLTLRSDHQPDYQMDIGATEPVGMADPEGPVAEDTGGELEMVLLIRKADLIGNSQWEFRHGKSTIHANIEDMVWLDRYHRGLGRVDSYLSHRTMAARVTMAR